MHAIPYSVPSCPRYARKPHPKSQDMNINIPTTAIHRNVSAPKLVPTLTPLLFFATTAVPVAPLPTTTAVAVQLVPQVYPLGQHPPPPPLSQLYHPNAHPLTPKAGWVPLGTRTVTPRLFRVVMGEATGQDVRAQSRPTWQQPALR